MDQKDEARILQTLEQIRKQTKALIIVGFTEDDRFFYSVDGMVTPETIERTLSGSARDVAGSVRRKRQLDEARNR